jgi:hypothetical protein
MGGGSAGGGAAAGGGGYGAIAGWVGSAMQAIAAAQAQREMFSQFNKEMHRQGQYGHQARDLWNTNVQDAGYEGLQSSMQKNQAERQQLYSNIENTPLAPGAQENGMARAAADLQGVNRAKLGAYGDWSTEQGIGNLHAQQGLDKITNFAGGDASVFPYRMDKAQHSMDELKFWGELVSSLGGASGSMDMSFMNSSPKFSTHPGQPGYGLDAPQTSPYMQYSNPIYPQVDPSTGNVFNPDSVIG